MVSATRAFQAFVRDDLCPLCGPGVFFPYPAFGRGGAGDGRTARPEAGRRRAGHLRATHADREQVIGTLKTAFVQGMLAKDEFDLRVGQTLASRTHAELDLLTADLPAGLAAVHPPQPAVREEGEPRIRRSGRVVAVATVLYAAVWALAFLLPENSEGERQPGLTLIVLTGFCYAVLLLGTVTPILADWLNKHW